MTFRKKNKICRARHRDLRNAQNVLVCQRKPGHKGHHRCGMFTWTEVSPGAIPRQEKP